MKRCVECGGELKPFEREERRTVSGQTFATMLRGRKCTACEFKAFDGASLEGFERAIAQHIAEHGPVSGEAFKWMRKAGLAMRAVDLAALLGVAPETLSRWETGEREVPRAEWAAVAALVLEQPREKRPMLERLQRLAKGPPKATRTVVRLSADETDAAE